MKKIFTNKQDLIFLIIGILLLLLLVGVLFGSINFLIRKIKPIFYSDLIKTEEIASFNLGEVEKIKPLLTPK